MPLKDGLGDYYKQSTRQIEDIVELVRGKLSTMSRITLGALIVIDVHGEFVDRQGFALFVQNHVKVTRSLTEVSKLYVYIGHFRGAFCLCVRANHSMI